MHDDKIKKRNDPSEIDLFKAEPPVQGAHESLGAFAYRALRDAIRAGRIPPGPHIRELEVARWLKISRTPCGKPFTASSPKGFLQPGRGMA